MEIMEKAKKQWELVERCIRDCRRVYLFGPPGVGKTHCAREMLGKLGLQAWRVVLNEDIAVQELLGMFMPRSGEFVWMDGPFVMAMRKGALIIDEIHRASGAVLDMLLGVLDDNPSGVSLPTGETIAPHSHFRAVATANVPPDGLDAALVDRFETVLCVSYPHPQLVEVLNQQIEGLGTFVLKSYEDENPVSPRRALNFARLVREWRWNETDAARVTFGDERAEELLAALAISKA